MSFKTTFFSGSVPCLNLKTGQIIQYDGRPDDGHLQLGISHDYEVLTTGQYSGTTNITINSKTHALSNNCVRDNRTSKMWARYVPLAEIGPAADGRLFWSQWTLAAESCTFNAAAKTITAAAGTPFDIAALCVGRKINLTGTANNNIEITVAAIANNIITTDEVLVNEGPINTSFATVDDLIWDFLAQANANSLGGYPDWTIPNFFELPSLLNIGNNDPSIDSAVFPSTVSAYHLSSSQHPSYTAQVFAVNFSHGIVGSVKKKTSKNYCRLVRS